jgi:RimJ/RimL family protein N-acetyltransferase
METVQSGLGRLRALSPSEGTRLVFRKLIHRKVLLGRYEMLAGASVAPDVPLALGVDFLGDPDFDQALGSTPYLGAADLEHFRQQESTCIVVRDGSRIVGSTWVTRGRVYVSELHRHVNVPEGEYYMCRSYVEPGYRSMSLMSHMIHAFAQRLPPQDRVWGLCYPRNVASVRSLERLGWRHTGDYWTRFVLGRKIPGKRHFPARPPTTLTCSS